MANNNGMAHIQLTVSADPGIDRETDRSVPFYAAQEDGFAPGTYSVLFEDPDGIRVEANLVSGKGHLEPGVSLPAFERPM